MRKRIASLFLALLVCMGLTVPALAVVEANQTGLVSGAYTYIGDGAFSNQSALRQFTCRSKNVQITGSNVFYGVYDCIFCGYPDSTTFQQYVDAMPKTYQKQVTDINTYTVQWVDTPTNNTFQSLSAASDPKPAAPAFTDVAASACYAAPVQWVVGRGVTTGVTSTTFAPDNTCTRARIVTFLYRAFAD